VRLESGRMEYRYTEVSIRKAFDDVLDMLAGAIREKGLTVVRPSGDADVVAWADQDRVLQILMNLIMNAVKYTPLNGGTITLTFGKDGESVFACVKDCGPGIATEKLESIFEPFVQLTSGLAERRGGVGLGLAICRDLARAMHGDVTVKSTEGSGCVFTLTLPNAKAATHGEATPPPVSRKATH
jgi:signal transduction histidine kinase